MARSVFIEKTITRRIRYVARGRKNKIVRTNGRGEIGFPSASSRYGAVGSND